MSDETGEVLVDDPWPVWPEGFAASSEDVSALLVLSALRGITPRRMLEVGVQRGTAAATLAWIRAGRAGSEKDRAFARTLDADAILAATKACGARLVPWDAPEYPEQLRAIHDPPAALFLAGAAIPDPTRAVAIVGARRCTELGREVAREVGRTLGLAGVAVVSGAARGIDAAAHEGALSADAPTIAILGCGLDIAYPPGSRDLLRRMLSGHGSVMSEYPPGVPPDPWNFPARNRIVAGLCSATVVVEGADGSGSMITAEHALEFGREVFAMPGAVTNPLACIPLRLIREGATMIRGAEDLLEDLGLQLVQEEVEQRVALSEAERAVLGCLLGPALPDKVASELRATIPEVVGVLMRLELRGFVRSVGGRYESTLKARPRADGRRPPGTAAAARRGPSTSS